MANFVVTTLVDEAFGGGTEAAETTDGAGLSLREAIGLANAAGGANTITFSAGLSGTIQLTQGSELTLSSAITIDGDTNGDNVADIVISGDVNGDDATFALDGYTVTDVFTNTNESDNVRVFNVKAKDVVLDALVVTGGLATNDRGGGGILIGRNQEASVQNALIAGNSTTSSSNDGGGITNFGGTLVLKDSTVSYNIADDRGGGVMNTGQAVIANVTLSNNSADKGGGYASGIAGADGTLFQVTAVGNHADNEGGGIFVDNVTSVTLLSSTLTGNTANNHAGARIELAGTIANSIIMGNAADGANPEILAPGTTLDGTNLIGDELMFGTTAIQTGVVAADVFASTAEVGSTGVFAGVLVDNGGATETVALRGFTGNPAIDIATATLLPTEADLGVDVDGDGTIETTAISVDGRGSGFDRVVDIPGQDGTLDIGAYEVQPGDFNFAPTAVDDSFSTDQNTSVSTTNNDRIILNDVDPEGDALTIVAIDGVAGAVGQTITVAGGLATLNVSSNGAVTLAPTAAAKSLDGGQKLIDSVTVTIADVAGNTATSVLTLEIAGTNDAAVIVGDFSASLKVGEKESVSGVIGVSDVDAGDNPSFAGVTHNGLHGVLTVNATGDEWTYTLDEDTPEGATHDRFYVSDNEGNEAYFSFTISSPNLPPVAVDDFATTNEDTPIIVTSQDGLLANDDDPSSADTIAVKAVNGLESLVNQEFSVADGMATLRVRPDGEYYLTPTAAAQSLDAGDSVEGSVEYTIIDNYSNTATATFEFVITGADDPAVVTGDTTGSVQLSKTGEPETTSGSIGVTDIDADDHPTFANATAVGTYGTIAVDGFGTTWTYTLDPSKVTDLDEGAFVEDTLLLTDDGGNEQTIDITVWGNNLAPVAAADVVNVAEDETAVISALNGVLANDTDRENDSLEVVAVDGIGAFVGQTILLGGGLVELTLEADGSYTVAPTANARIIDAGSSVPVSVGYSVSDGNGNFDTAELTIIINGRDNAAVVSGDTTGSVVEGETETTSGSIGVSDADLDDDPTFANATAVGAYGAISVNGAGTSWIYKLDDSKLGGLDEGKTEDDVIVLTDSEGNRQTITVSVTKSSCPDTITGTNGDDDLVACPNGTTIYGLAGNDSLLGLEGADSLFGEKGADYLNGGDNNDFLSGGAKKDKLLGGSGDDLLDGGRHKDKLTGGAGADIFRFDEKVKKKHADKIKDFEVGTDSIQLGFSKIGSQGVLKDKFFDTGKVADSGKDRILYQKSKGWLRYDADGKGGKDAVKFAKVDKKLDLSADDFMVI